MLDAEKIVYTSYTVTLDLSAPVNWMLTPELLLENNVVPAEWAVDLEAPQSRGIIQRFRFQEGLLVQAHPDRLYLLWDIIPEEEIQPQIVLCNAIAEALLKLPTVVEIEAFVVQLQGHKMMPANSLGVTNLGVPLEEIFPVVGFRATYDLDIRQVQFDIEEAALALSEYINCLQFTYGIRYLSDEGVPNQEAWQFVVAFQDEWVEECSSLVEAFYANHIGE